MRHSVVSILNDSMFYISVPFSNQITEYVPSVATDEIYPLFSNKYMNAITITFLLRITLSHLFSHMTFAQYASLIDVFDERRATLRSIISERMVNNVNDFHNF